MIHPTLDEFKHLAQSANLIPVHRTLFADALTPVQAYRRLVRPDARMAPSFLLESVEGGERVGRYSYLGARPVAEIIARRHRVTYRTGDTERTYHSDDPLGEMHKLTRDWKLAQLPGELPGAGVPELAGGWVGCCGYDVVRYLEPEKLSGGPPDDRGLPDIHMQLYTDVVAFDHARKTVQVIACVHLDGSTPPESAYHAGLARLEQTIALLNQPCDADVLPLGDVDLTSPPPKLPPSNMGVGGYQAAVRKCKEYIAAGDAFQIVPSQRFELTTASDPFDIYRALRVVNPSPYMVYMQIDGAILVASSPEILCRVEDGVATSRPLAGTRKRGRDDAEDARYERELREDPKDVAEHVMLVDLHRNDIGRVATPGTITLPEVLVVEKYSHVMHLSSTVRGTLREGMTCWDALRMSLPVGTVSGAPKVRAMQIIDELEPARRGPYAGALGYADFAGNLDMAIALRTMVVLPPRNAGESASAGGQTWTVHIQAGAGIVADSDPDLEHEETVSKAAALAKAVDVAQRAL